MFFGIVSSVIMLSNVNPIKNNRNISKTQIDNSKKIIVIFLALYIMLIVLNSIFPIYMNKLVLSMSLANTLNFILHYMEKIRIKINDKANNII